MSNYKKKPPKARVTVSVEQDTIDKLRQYDVNRSQLFEDAARAKIKDIETKKILEQLKKL